MSTCMGEPQVGSRASKGNRMSEESGSGRASSKKRSSNVFAALGRNSDLMTASNLRLFASHVLEVHRDNKADFVYVIQVSVFV